MPAPIVPTFRILAESTNAEGLTVLKPLFATKNRETFTEVCASITCTDGCTATKAATEKKRLRAPTVGNRRPVKVTKVINQDQLEHLQREGYVELSVKAGKVWPSVLEASESMGLQHNSLRQLLYAARHSAEGRRDCPVVIRGVELAYADLNESSDRNEAIGA